MELSESKLVILQHKPISSNEKIFNEIIRIIATLIAIYGGGRLVSNISEVIDDYSHRTEISNDMAEVLENDLNFSVADLIPDYANIVEKMGIMEGDERSSVRNAIDYMLNQLDHEEFTGDSTIDLLKMELGVFKSRIDVTEDTEFTSFLNEFKELIQRSLDTIKEVKLPAHQMLFSSLLVVFGALSVVLTHGRKSQAESIDAFNRSTRILTHTLNTMLDLFDPNTTAPEAPISKKNTQNRAKFELARMLVQVINEYDVLVLDINETEEVYTNLAQTLKRITYAKDSELASLIRALKLQLKQFRSSLSRKKEGLDNYLKSDYVDQFKRSLSAIDSLLLNKLIEVSHTYPRYQLPKSINSVHQGRIALIGSITSFKADIDRFQPESLPKGIDNVIATIQSIAIYPDPDESKSRLDETVATLKSTLGELEIVNKNYPALAQRMYELDKVLTDLLLAIRRMIYMPEGIEN